MASLLAGVIGFLLLLFQAKADKKKGIAYLTAISSDDENLQTAHLDAARESEEFLRDIDSPLLKKELEEAGATVELK